MELIQTEPIKHFSDYQVDWARHIKPLVKKRFDYKSAEFLSIPGDAPKGFLLLREEAPGAVQQRNRRLRRISRRKSKWRTYIAKVGSKWYPMESVTEQLLTRLGQVAGLRIASSQLRIVGGQVRFLSRYFLKKGEYLYHGFDLFRHRLGEEIVTQIAEARDEPSFYTFQTIGEAILDTYPDQFDCIMRGLAEMVAFDCLVGNNDRHPANWGLIVEATGARKPRFSPVFDTARALFWNSSEEFILKVLKNNAKLESYVRKTMPQIGLDRRGAVSHFELVQWIFENHPEYRDCLTKYASDDFLVGSQTVIEKEFETLMSPVRCESILLCLQRRHSLLRQALSKERKLDGGS